MRNFTKTLAVVSLLAPASAQPLGIGDLKLHSALNQRLNAEINLILSPDEKPSDIRVRLAAPEKFDEAGIPWSYFLSKIKFDTLVKTNGAVVVKLSSKDALQEPFLDFLVEVSWANGNMYREFTVLVDPPTAYQQPIIPVIEKMQPVPTAQTFSPTRATSRRATKAPGDSFQGDAYGPTVRNDTLWEIAEKVKPSSGISTEQMMMALYEKNPEAFYKANVNALMEGTTLKIPDNNSIAKLSKNQAAKLFSQQVKNWKAAKNGQSLNDTSSLVASESENNPISSQLKLVAPVETNVSENAIVSPGQEQGNETVDETTSALSGSAMQGTEEAVLQGRIKKLESRVEELQKMLVLKDEQLALLQNKAAVQKSTEKKPQAQTTAEKMPEGQAADVKQPVADKKLKELKNIKEPQQSNSEGFDSYYAMIGGLGVMILGGLGYLWWKRREIEEDYDTESMFNSSSEIRLPDTDVSLMTTAEEASNYDVGTVGESSFLSEFTPSDFDAFDSDQNEVDPISEADVYLAYGRYQQAEELIRQTIADNPQRQDCKLKLLEIFYANENKAAFEEYVNELVQEDMHSDSAFWSKVVEMGKEIIPDSALLSTVSNSGSHEESVSANFELSDDAIDAAKNDQPEDNEAKAQFDNGLEEITNEDLDFNMDEIFEDNSDPRSESSEKPSENSVEYDLNAMTETLGQDQKKIPNENIAEEEIESFEFDLGVDAKKQAIEETMDSETELDSTLTDSDEIVQNIDISKATKKDQLESAESDSEDFDFSFDLDLDNVSLENSDNSVESNAVSDITDMDEFETKIDLVKAYIDMGDAEAAKSIAEEVLKKGNNHQKQAAQSILDQIN